MGKSTGLHRGGDGAPQPLVQGPSEGMGRGPGKTSCQLPPFVCHVHQGGRLSLIHPGQKKKNPLKVVSNEISKDMSRKSPYYNATNSSFSHAATMLSADAEESRKEGI